MKKGINRKREYRKLPKINKNSIILAIYGNFSQEESRVIRLQMKHTGIYAFILQSDMTRVECVNPRLVRRNEYGVIADIISKVNQIIIK